MRRISEGYVYLLVAGSWTKIGKAKDVSRRVGQLRIQLPFAVDLEHVIDCRAPLFVEAQLHRLLDEFRANGEWFSLPEAILRELMRVAYVGSTADDGDGLPWELRGVEAALDAWRGPKYVLRAVAPDEDDPLAEFADTFLKVSPW